MLHHAKLKIGDLVRWQECYDDDPDIIRDAGIGILMKIREVEGVHQSSASEKKQLFSVYRNTHQDILILTKTHVCLLN